MHEAFRALAHWFRKYKIDPSEVEVQLLFKDRSEKYKAESALRADTAPMLITPTPDYGVDEGSIYGVRFRMKDEDPRRPWRRYVDTLAVTKEEA